MTISVTHGRDLSEGTAVEMHVRSGAVSSPALSVPLLAAGKRRGPMCFLGYQAARSLQDRRSKVTARYFGKKITMNMSTETNISEPQARSDRQEDLEPRPMATLEIWVLPPHDMPGLRLLEVWDLMAGKLRPQDTVEVQTIAGGYYFDIEMPGLEATASAAVLARLEQLFTGLSWRVHRHRVRCTPSRRLAACA
ncbi:MAG: hypothetical protein HYV63_16175 [Candidatus Schekmanbacteria bacterium]|nr:hypothetical protein [Candidatus Schekmanbacteria bacterium]